MPTFDIAAIKSNLCDDLQQLICHVEKSSPGFEYVGQEEILVRINRAAQQLGVSFICMDARVDGHRRSERFMVLRFPDSKQSYKICRHSNDAPDIAFPRTPEEDQAILEEMRMIDACECEALYNQKADRHITTSQERGLILTHLNAWLLWVNPNQLDDLITLDQLTPLMGISKRTLESYLHNNRLPTPDYPGGNGKAHKWLYRKHRSEFQQESKKLLPMKFPGSQLI